MPTVQLPGQLTMYYEDDDFTDPWETEVETATLVEVPVASGYVQHSAPAKCVALWRDFVQGLKR